ncbi:S1 family peptidase [Rhodococcus sp. 27YEA15]|uniref:S1 family peptidase n=1 Tax=Rhodococcus sp. 27YEA15 TaxID=3156259 RepID=UPI003C7CEA29
MPTEDIIFRTRAYGGSLRLRLLFAAAAASLATMLGGAGIAAAAPAGPPVQLGGGSGILLPDVDHSNPDTVVACTLTAVGFDNNGALVGLTAGHCGQVGDRVFAEYLPGAGPIGRFVYVSPVSDIAVIALDASKVSPSRTVGGTTINGIGTPPSFGTIVCKEGRSTGTTCGITWGYDHAYGQIVEHTCSIPGDSGGPLVVGDRLVGLISNGFPPYCFEPFPPPFHAPDNSADITIGLADINARGGGFRLY